MNKALEDLNIIQRVLLMSAFIAAITWAFASQTPSAKDYRSEAPGEFSQVAALEHLKIISEAPHHVGSAAHPKVRDYIVRELEDLGLEVELQKKTAARLHGSLRSAMTHNIVARMRGTSSGPALGLVSHYDSGVHSSYGASDAGSGVATLLEGMRAFVTSSPEPKNDIIVIITDAEELGLLGAQAFVEFHPWAKSLGLVLNFEARGSGGPSFMLVETNQGNAKLIEHFSKANIANPQANSLMYGIYKSLPNDTDLTVFRGVGDINGFNFAFIDDHFDYHTAQDTVDNLDLDTLNHQAQYLMAGLHYFSNIDLSQLRSDKELVYFNAPGLGMLHYPVDWGFALLLFSALGFLVIFWLGHRKEQLSIVGSVFSFLPLVAVLAGAYGIAWCIDFIAQQFPQYADIPHGFPYFGTGVMWAGLALASALCLAIYQFTASKRYKFKALDLLISPLLLWLLINLAVELYLPVAGFFILPSLLGLAALGAGVYSSGRTQILLPLVILAPSALIFLPLAPSFTIGLGLGMLWLSIIFVILLLSLLAPVLTPLRLNTPVSFALCLIAAACLAQALEQSSYSNTRKKPSSVNYVHNMDTQTSHLLSYNNSLDSFIERFFKEEDRIDKAASGQAQKTLPDDEQLYPVNRRSQPTYLSKTETLLLAAPQVSHSLKVEEDGLRLSLHVLPQRPSQLLQIGGAQGLRVLQARINDYDTATIEAPSAIGKRGLLLSHFSNQAGEASDIEILFEGQDPAALNNLTLYDIAFDLAEQLPRYQSRPKHTMAEPFLINDATILRMNIAASPKTAIPTATSTNSTLHTTSEAEDE